MKYLTSICIAIAAVSFTMPALAQDSSDDESGIDEIIVYSTKRAESAQDVPFSVTPLSADMIEDSVAVDITDLGFLVPNVQLQAVSTFPGFATLSMRGVGAGANSVRSIDPAVNIFVEGMPLASQIGAQLDVFDIETVEVLRGPQGVFFGRNSTGGAVSFRTGKPTEDFNARLKVGAGSHGLLLFEGTVQGSFSDAVRAKLAVQYREFDGFWDDNNGGTFEPAMWNPSGTEPGTFTGTPAFQESIFIKPTITFQPSDSFDLTLFMQYYEDDGGSPAAQAFFNPSLPDEQLLTEWGYTPPTDQFEVNHDLPGKGELEFTQLVAEANWNVGNGTFTSLTGWRDLDMLNSIDVDGGPFVILHFPDNDESAKQWTQEFRYLADISDSTELLLGVFYMESEMAVEERRKFSGDLAGRDHLDFLWIRGDWIQDQTSYAAFANVRFDLSDQWTLSAGARYTKEDKELWITRLLTCSGVEFNGCPNDKEFKEADWDNVSPRVGVEYRPHDNLMYWGSWTRGFRSGNFNARGPTFVALGPADPEQADQFEIGMKGDFMDGTFRANLAAFYTVYDEIQRITNQDIGGVPVQLLRNAAKATIPGVEVELTFVPTDALTLQGSFGWVDPEYDEFTGMPGFTPEEAVLLKFERIPEFEYMLAGDYTWNVGRDGQIIYRLQYAYRDGFPTNLANFPERFIDSYSILDMGLRYEQGGLRVAVWGRNLGEENYGDIISSARNQHLFGGQAESYGVEVSWDF